MNSTYLEQAFRQLRNAWFTKQLMLRGPEREWENDEEIEYRDELNRKRRASFDKETELIIEGNQDVKVVPRCLADLTMK